ncbi:MAG: pyridoxal 5'-phosphate synthase glutaminase subunit PdxT [Anaerolineaceae bacterium]|nr:pyridoxal 5'-phosphate synthase glutaminase subunit PdxT [Anaerolineaceae bacterium]
MKIGVLALQGDFAEHQAILEKLGAEVVQVRLPEHLAELNGLIIPGGESTTIGKLAVHYGLIEPLQEFGQRHAIWGTCAGAIFLSNDIHRDQPLLRLMDISVERNAFGRQVDSFEIDLDVPCLDEMDQNKKPFHAIFIRAPLIDAVHGNAHELARLPDNALKGPGKIVAAQQGKLLATSFHPELSDDGRFHRYFMEMAR